LVWAVHVDLIAASMASAVGVGILLVGLSVCRGE